MLFLKNISIQFNNIMLKKKLYIIEFNIYSISKNWFEQEEDYILKQQLEKWIIY